MESNVENIRTKVSEKLTPIPKFLSTVCMDMLYNEQFTKIVYLMPMPYLHYDNAGILQVLNELGYIL